jgi:DNA-binding transcriptional MerR regulator
MTTLGGAAAADRPAYGPALMSIGEVLAQLRPDFPDITISKLRFLESEGLVEPYRAPSGYRKYTADHLERLRFVLAAQRDRYLPLRVIREQIEATDRGERVVGLTPPPAPSPLSPGAGAARSPGVAPSSGVAPVAAPSPPSTVPSVPVQPTRPPMSAEPAAPVTAEPSRSGVRAEWSDQRMTRAQLAERSGLDESGLVDLEGYGLLPTPTAGFYGGEALAVARIAARLAEYGLEARHLRPYRTMADREVGLLAQLVPTLAHQGGRDGRQQALETVHELAALCAQLHSALVRHGLRQTVGF